MNSSACHVGLTVRDLDSTLEFYRDVPNLPVISCFEAGGGGFAAVVSVGGALARLVHLDGGDVRVELVGYDPIDTDTDELTLNRPGTTHLGLSVEDADTAVA